VRAAGVLGWAALAGLLAAWLAVVEVFWLPLRLGGVLVPISVPAAVVGNLLLVGATHRVSRSKLPAVLPAVVWLVVVLAAAQRRSEGDLLITGGGAATSVVDLGFLLLGVVAAAFAVGKVIAGPGRQPVSRSGGSGSGGAR